MGVRPPLLNKFQQQLFFVRRPRRRIEALHGSCSFLLSGRERREFLEKWRPLTAVTLRLSLAAIRTKLAPLAFIESKRSSSSAVHWLFDRSGI
jgi:hypothetical protein